MSKPGGTNNIGGGGASHADGPAPRRTHSRGAAFKSALLPVVVGLTLFACYYPTLAPTISAVDSGALVTAVHTMGVPGPTGYPLFLIVGKVFDLLPLGEPARSVVLMSAVAVAIAGGLITWVVMVLTASRAGAALAGLAAGLNWWVWGEAANQAEVYGLHMLLLSLLLAAFVRWQREPTPRTLAYLALASGLALTHHRTSIFFILPALGWALMATRPMSIRLLARTAVWAALPLLLYLWLPLRSAFAPPLNWGNTSASLGNFIYHLSGRMFFHFALSDTLAGAVEGTRQFGLQLLTQLGAIGVPLTLAGVVGMLRTPSQRALGVVLMISAALVVTWAAFYRVPDKPVFYTPALIPIAIFLGAGLAYAGQWARVQRSSPRLTRQAPVLAVAVIAAMVVWLVGLNREEVDRSQEWEPLEAATAAAAGVPPQAVMLLLGEQYVGAVQYYFYCYRKDREPPTIFNADHLLYVVQEPLPPPPLDQAVLAARAAPGDHEDQLEALVRSIRAHLDPQTVLSTNIARAAAPPGYVVLVEGLHHGDDPKMAPRQRLVPPPGIPLGDDDPRWRPALDLPHDAGSLLAVEVSAEAARGEPFAVTAAIRWAGAPREQTSDLHHAYLRLWFVHSAASREGQSAAARSQMQGARTLPVLFGASPPASEPGRHYRQVMWVVLPRAFLPGLYHVGVEVVGLDLPETEPVLAGMMAVR